MNTTELKQEIKKLKVDLRNRIQKFNKDSGIDISGIIVEAQFATELMDDTPVVKGYQVGVNIEL